ncbi:MAG TPA: hypothetical protein ENJ42_05190 [Hellea balneolensis]|uniref:Uncharacterized protein n=1 Tax=Hellea balneolensis TaxID=287478 RepID=A0A7C5M013_9PROT|nr:hypothetical protein [Hellea balneolensis]
MFAERPCLILVTIPLRIYLAFIKPREIDDFEVKMFPADMVSGFNALNSVYFYGDKAIGFKQ